MLIRRGAFDRIGLFDASLRTADFIDWYARAQIRGLRMRMLPNASSAPPHSRYQYRPRSCRRAASRRPVRAQAHAGYAPALSLVTAAIRPT